MPKKIKKGNIIASFVSDHKKAIVGIALVAIVVAALVFYRGAPLTSKQIMTATIYYKDGTTKPFNGLTIVDTTGKEVDRIVLSLALTVNFQGTATNHSWSLSSLSGGVSTGAPYIPLFYTTPQVAPSGSGAPITSGVSEVLWITTINMNTMQSSYSNWISGNTYYMRYVVGTLTLTINFSDGVVRTTTTTAGAFLWQFTYSTSGITSLSLTWGNTPIFV